MRTASSPASSSEAAPAAYRSRPSVPGPIVVATTGDDVAATFDAARRLASRAGVPVRVVSVVEPAPPPMAGLDGSVAWAPDVATLIALQRQRVAAQLASAGGDAAWPVDVLVGSPAQAITDAARASGASLLVMGIGRHDVAARLLGGELALRTIRRTRTPVLAVTDQPLRVPARIAVAATDFSASSVKAARAALDLLGDGGTLYLLHVWSRTAIGHPALLEQDDAYERALPDRLARVARLLSEPARDVAVVSTSLVGHVAQQVADFARARGADLVAAGSRGHGLLERLLVGRVTSAIVRAAPCAVLVTPEPAAAERAELALALAESTESHRREEWAALLDAFSRRNVGRRAAVEVDDLAVGAQAQESGYAFHGATYDRHDGRVELMLGDANDPTRHLTRMIADAASIGVHSDAGGRDVALVVRRDGGQTLLTFMDDAPPSAATA